MDFARAVQFEQSEMLGRRVALVAVETVLREAFVHAAHFRVSRGFGEDRCGRDDRMKAIALDNGAGAAWQLRAAVAVDPGFVRRDAKRLHRALHREHGGLQYVEAIDFLDRGVSDRHKGYPTPQHLALLERYGPSEIHRRSFAPVRRILQPA